MALKLRKPVFYRVGWDTGKNDISGLAYGPEDVDGMLVWDGRPIGERVWNPKSVKSWREMRFELRDGTFADYQMNDTAWRMCSARMREIIDARASPLDRFEWLDLVVQAEDGEERDYYVLHFLDSLPLDILVKEKSVVNEDHPNFIYVPWFDVAAIGDHNVWAYQGETVGWYVSKDIRDALLAAKCTGFYLRKARQS